MKNEKWKKKNFAFYVQCRAVFQKTRNPILYA